MHYLLHPGLQAIDLVLLSELLLVSILHVQSLMQRKSISQVLLPEMRWDAIHNFLFDFFVLFQGR